MMQNWQERSLSVECVGKNGSDLGLGTEMGRQRRTAGRAEAAGVAGVIYTATEWGISGIEGKIESNRGKIWDSWVVL